MNYLATELEGKVSKEDLEKLIKIGENVVEHEATHVAKKESDPDYDGLYNHILPASIEKFAKEIDDKLATIKVCDPAIGSGAFPVGMMNAIVKARMVLSSYLKDKNRTLYTFKRDCIQNSLYGVDIDPGAVEIAKLRLWLSLVVDEDNIKQIKPLPNLDYKIMQGNSLLEEFEGIKLFDEKLIAIVDTGKEKQLESLKQKQAALQKEYFELHSQNKLTPARQEELNSELKKLQKQTKKLSQSEKVIAENAGLFDIYSEAKKKADDLKRLHKEFFEATQKSKKDNIKKQIEQLEWELIEATLKEQNKISALKKLEEFKRSNIKPFFLWKLNFADVFEEKGGFDVMIGNPPYIDYRKIDATTKNVIKKYRIAKHSKMINLYLYFFERGLELLSINGTLSFISPQQYLILDNCKGLRDIFRENTVLTLSDFARVKIFNASTYTFVSIVQKKSSSVPGIYLEFNQIADLSSPIRQLKIPNPILEPVNISDYSQLTNRMESTAKFKLGDFSDIFCASSSSSLELSESPAFGVPFITATDIKRWKIDNPRQYIKVNTYGSNSAKKQSGSVIYTSRMTSVIRAAYVKNNKTLGGKINVIKLTHLFNPLFITSLLNSRLINFWYREKFSMQHMQGGALPINTPELKKIPVKEMSEAEQKPFIDLVEKILKITEADDYLKNAEKQAKVRDIEHQIDELVYKLYGLTDEEIKIVEKPTK